MKYPTLHILDQNFETSTGASAERSVAAELERTKLLGPIGTGQTVVITAGSRGVDSMAAVLRSLAGAVKARGAMPVILPAMGSHGGGTAQGQVTVLEHLEITSTTVGAAIHDRLEPVVIAEVEGSPVFADRAVINADHIILVNRIKEHTEFIGEIESGLLKMAVVGLGRIAGAEVMHQLAVRISYARAIRAIAQALFKHLRILGGIAILEDKTNRFRRLEAIPQDAVFKREPELLREACRYHAMLPFNQLDLLLVDEIGKEISGAGFDTKVIGRIRNIYEKECEQPRITRIVLRDLSAKTGGNAIGIGLADFVHRRVVEKMNPAITALNSITAVAPEKAMVPITLPSDRQALEAAFQSIGPWNNDSVRMAWIVNTAEIKSLAVSPALAREARLKGLSVSDYSFIPAFDTNGDLAGLRERLLAEP
ncbi:MAG: DUF362 domain-containing protein [Desulfobacterales bacterium]|jgi:hypothetical protein